MSSCSCASRAAMMTSKSSMVESHILMFAEMVSSNSVMSWSTTAREPTMTSRGYALRGFPSKRISPLQGW